MTDTMTIWLALGCTIGPVLVAGIVAWLHPDLG